jgi:hypothetical protein
MVKRQFLIHVMLIFLLTENAVTLNVWQKALMVRENEYEHTFNYKSLSASDRRR